MNIVPFDEPGTYEGEYSNLGNDAGDFWERMRGGAEAQFDRARKGAKSAAGYGALYGRRGLAAALTAAAEHPLAAGWVAGSAVGPLLANALSPKRTMDHYMFRDRGGVRPEGFVDSTKARVKGMAKDAVDGGTLGLAGALMGWHKEEKKNRVKTLVNALKEQQQYSPEELAIRAHLANQGAL